MLAQLQTGVPILTAGGWFISNTTEAWLGAFCITRFVDPRKTFDSVRGVLTLVDGQLSIVSQLQRGTTIHARVPFDPTSGSASMVCYDMRFQDLVA